MAVSQCEIYNFQKGIRHNVKLGAIGTLWVLTKKKKYVQKERVPIHWNVRFSLLTQDGKKERSSTTAKSYWHRLLYFAIAKRRTHNSWLYCFCWPLFIWKISAFKYNDWMLCSGHLILCKHNHKTAPLSNQSVSCDKPFPWKSYLSSIFLSFSHIVLGRSHSVALFRFEGQKNSTKFQKMCVHELFAPNYTKIYCTSAA